MCVRRSDIGNIEKDLSLLTPICLNISAVHASMAGPHCQIRSKSEAQFLVDFANFYFFLEVIILTIHK